MAGAACMAHTQLHMHACVNKAWSAGKSCCCPGTAYQCHSVTGRTGFANFSASLAMLPPLALIGVGRVFSAYVVFLFFLFPS
eukprot:1156846-Pelagomonas_calceolata.AAC.1